MSAKYQIMGVRSAHGQEDGIWIADKHTLAGALNFATDIWEFWDHVTIREREENSDAFKIVAALNRNGMFA